MSDLIFLDNGATSYPKPEEVYTFMDHFYRNFGVNPGRSGYDASLEAEEMVLGTRKMLTEFFGGTACNYLTFSYNASDTLNMIIQGMTEKGDHVVTTNVEHNSVLRPLYHLKHDGVIEITVDVHHDDGYVEVSVIDDGYGIPGEVIKKIFDPFFSTKAGKKNTGLGLSICQHIIESHQGIITCSSDEKTTFNVRLPVLES